VRRFFYCTSIASHIKVHGIDEAQMPNRILLTYKNPITHFHFKNYYLSLHALGRQFQPIEKINHNTL